MSKSNASGPRARGDLEKQREHAKYIIPNGLPSILFSVDRERAQW